MISISYFALLNIEDSGKSCIHTSQMMNLSRTKKAINQYVKEKRTQWGKFSQFKKLMAILGILTLIVAILSLMVAVSSFLFYPEKISQSTINIGDIPFDTRRELEKSKNLYEGPLKSLIKTIQQLNKSFERVEDLLEIVVDSYTTQLNKQQPEVRNENELYLSVDKKSLNPGETFELHIVIDSPKYFAGCNFLLTYPENGVTLADPPVSSTFFNNSAYNIDSRGEIIFVGTFIDYSGGGFSGIKKVLFTVKFKVRNNVSVPYIYFELQQNALFNPDAEIGRDVNKNGKFDPKDGDKIELMPILIGAVPQTHKDFSDINMAFPVVLDVFKKNPNLTIELSE